MSNPQTFLNIPIAGSPYGLPPGTPNISYGANSAPNGYATAGVGGPSVNRPRSNDPGAVTLQVGTHYLDTSLSACVVWDGATWRNPFTGAIA